MNVAPAGDGSARLTFTDPGTGATGYKIQYSFNLEPGSWVIPDFTLEDLGDSAWQADLDGLDPARGFLRVKLLGLGGGIRAYFDPADLNEAVEGSIATATVYFTQSYSGPLYYRWTGTAAIETPTGVVQVDGTTASIQLSLLENLILYNNRCSIDGGAIMVETGGSGVPLFRNLRFSGNHSAGRGGAVFNWDRSIEFVNCQFDRNRATLAGGAVINYNSRSTYTQCLFTNNQANFGGAAANENGSAAGFINCSFDANAAFIDSGDIHDYNSALTTVKNCILWGATEDGAPSVYDAAKASANSGNNLIGGAEIGGIVVANRDPLYRHDLSKLFHRFYADLRLTFNSPAIDLGNDAANSEAVDIAGIQRIQSTAIDLGAHEFVPAFTVEPNPDETLFADTEFLSTTLTPLLSGIVSDEARDAPASYTTTTSLYSQNSLALLPGEPQVLAVAKLDGDTNEQPAEFSIFQFEPDDRSKLYHEHAVAAGENPETNTAAFRYKVHLYGPDPDNATIVIPTPENAAVYYDATSAVAAIQARDDAVLALTRFPESTYYQDLLLDVIYDPTVAEILPANRVLEIIDIDNEVLNANSQAKVKTLMLELNTLQVDSLENAIALTQELGRMVGLYREKTTLEGRIVTHSAELHHRFFADPVHRLRFLYELHIATRRFETAQQFTYFLARTLEYKWNEPFDDILIHFHHSAVTRQQN